MMRFSLVLLFSIVFSALAQAQTGPCTESAVKKGELPTADDAFSYMPPYGKPVTGTAATEEAAKKSFSDRMNRKFEWASGHRIVASPSGDMAYEHGTMHVSYDDKSDGKHHTFDAVMLNVFKAKGAVCQQVAMTMQPLEDTFK
jgi:ketosteroid isomerase-like protein